MNKDAAEMLFEPTGDLAKDYSAYCETADKIEREDILDAVQVEELADTAPGSSKHVINFNMRNIDYCLNKRDAEPFTQAIPHCKNLQKISLTSCGLTEHSYKLFVKAVYKSPSVTSFSADFNPNALFKDPTVSKKDKNEVFVNPADFKGGFVKPLEPEVKEEKKGKPDPKKQVVKEEPVVEKPPISLPTGWHAILLTGIQQLSLRGNAINDKQLELFCPLLEANTDLLSLSLWGNDITSAGCTMLAKALQKNHKLTALNLGHNRIDDAGVAALCQAFYTVDLPNEDALKVRQTVFPAQLELPPYPSFTDLAHQANQGSADEKKDPKKKDAGKGKGKSEGPVERHKNEFDKDCIRVDEGHLRVPGNSVLWSLNLSHNVGIGAEGVAALVTMLTSTEPSYELKEPLGPDQTFPTPSPYVATCGLDHIEVHHPSISPELKKKITDALGAAAGRRQSIVQTPRQ